MRKFLHDFVDPAYLPLTPFAPGCRIRWRLAAAAGFRLSKPSLRGNCLRNTSLLGRASLTNAVCATAPSFTCLSQI